MVHADVLRDRGRDVEGEGRVGEERVETFDAHRAAACSEGQEVARADWSEASTLEGDGVGRLRELRLPSIVGDRVGVNAGGVGRLRDIVVAVVFEGVVVLVGAADLLQPQALSYAEELGAQVLHLPLS